SNGVISIAPASIAAAGAGSGFSITLTNVNNAACPGLASVMQHMSDIISIEGRGGAAIVKDNIAVPRVPYSASAAEAQCAEGDSNTYVFTVRSMEIYGSVLTPSPPTERTAGPRRAVRLCIAGTGHRARPDQHGPYRDGQPAGASGR